jgi:alkanesulfonate monooxygenase SsuD/methylene tetrahydromethanopterin reductase-like flavin-dependent oxidoreductase (luciferase family)
MDKPEFDGRWVKFKGVNAMPRPVQKPHPEIVFGGHTPEAYSRAARLARGWYGFALDLEGTRKCIDGLRAACSKVGRKFDELEISVTPRPPVNLDAVKRFAELGVHRLILLNRANDEGSLLGEIDTMAKEMVGKA